MSDFKIIVLIPFIFAAMFGSSFINAETDPNNAILSRNSHYVTFSLDQNERNIIAQGCDIGPPPSSSGNNLTWGVKPGDALIFAYHDFDDIAIQRDAAVDELVIWAILEISSDTNSLKIMEIRQPQGTYNCMWKSFDNAIFVEPKREGYWTSYEDIIPPFIFPVTKNGVEFAKSTTDYIIINQLDGELSFEENEKLYYNAKISEEDHGSVIGPGGYTIDAGSSTELVSIGFHPKSGVWVESTWSLDVEHSSLHYAVSLLGMDSFISPSQPPSMPTERSSSHDSEPNPEPQTPMQVYSDLIWSTFDVKKRDDGSDAIVTDMKSSTYYTFSYTYKNIGNVAAPVCLDIMKKNLDTGKVLQDSKCATEVTLGPGESETLTWEQTLPVGTILFQLDLYVTDDSEIITDNNRSTIRYTVTEQETDDVQNEVLGCTNHTLGSYSINSPTIDGIERINEWNDASHTRCTFSYNGNIYTLDASMKNDNDNLYSKLVLNGDQPSEGFLGFRFEIENNPDVLADSIGSHMFSSGGVGYNDDFHLPSKGSERDVEHGGQFNVIGAQQDLSSTRILELSHPLCSGDEKDFCLSPGEKIFFDIIWTTIDKRTDIDGSLKFHYQVPKDTGSADTSVLGTDLESNQPESYDLTIFANSIHREYPEKNHYGTYVENGEINLNDKFVIEHRIVNQGPNIVDNPYYTITTTQGISILPVYSSGCDEVTEHYVKCSFGRELKVLDPQHSWSSSTMFKVNSNIDSTTQTITTTINSKQSGDIDKNNNQEKLTFTIEQSQLGTLDSSPDSVVPNVNNLEFDQVVYSGLPSRTGEKLLLLDLWNNNDELSGRPSNIIYQVKVYKDGQSRPYFDSGKFEVKWESFMKNGLLQYTQTGRSGIVIDYDKAGKYNYEVYVHEFDSTPINTPFVEKFSNTIIDKSIPTAPKTGTVFATNVNILYGTSVPGCEESNTCYDPFSIKASVGETVTWTNQDTAAHTVTSGSPDNGPDGIFDSSLIMGGQKFSHTFTSFGSYDYFCMVHPWMLGSVTILSNIDRPNSNKPHTSEPVIDTNSRQTYDSNQLQIVSVTSVDQQGNKINSFKKGGSGFAKIIVSGANIQNPLITANLFDASDFTLGLGSIRTSINGQTEIIVQFQIPNDATTGKGKIYVNIFSDWPSNGGTPITSESLGSILIQ